MKAARGRGVNGYVPTKEEIRTARGDLNQGQAAAMIFANQARWSMYETGEARMHPASWELFLIKRGLKNAISESGGNQEDTG